MRPMRPSTLGYLEFNDTDVLTYIYYIYVVHSFWGRPVVDSRCLK